MKKYSYLLLIAFLFTRCSSFLDVDPKTSISGEQVIHDETSAKAALSGVYVSLRNYYSIDFQSIGYLSGDNIEWTGSQSQIQEFINHKVNPENATIERTWNGIYTSVNRVNNLINALESDSELHIEEDMKSSILGQAYAIRALNYFDLARVWGGVPLITVPTENVGENAGIERSTIEETYHLIGQDLDKAESLLQATATDRFNVTQATVWALQARFHLYSENWEKAKDYAEKVITDNSYELLDPYFSFFKNNVVGTKESVFEIFYSNDELNSHRGQWQPQSNGGTRQWAPNSTLVDLLTNPATGGARSELIKKDNQGRWYGDLYYRSPATDPTYIIRIAELYFIRSEANARLGELNLALEDLNKIRKRAQLDTKEKVESMDVILKWIEDERRLEFALESDRWFDLVRTGRAQEVLGIDENFRLLLPIPFSQLLADPVIKQNPGYSSK